MKRFVIALAAWLVLTTSLVTLAVWSQPVHRAVLGMGWGLILFWIGAGGGLMYRYRDALRALALKWRWPWTVKFVLLATALALLEEAITTTMTDFAPLFGVRVGQAYITASANYLDVVLCHSVVVFIPGFVAWACLLSKVRFSAAQVFVLYGLFGILAECSFGPQHALEFGLGIFVYGLMVWLPAYVTEPDRTGRPPRWWHFPIAVVLPALSVALLPTPLLIKLLSPGHPVIHFPPIG